MVNTHKVPLELLEDVEMDPLVFSILLAYPFTVYYIVPPTIGGRYHSSSSSTEEIKKVLINLMDVMMQDEKRRFTPEEIKLYFNEISNKVVRVGGLSVIDFIDLVREQGENFILVNPEDSVDINFLTETVYATALSKEFEKDVDVVSLVGEKSTLGLEPWRRNYIYRDEDVLVHEGGQKFEQVKAKDPVMERLCDIMRALYLDDINTLLRCVVTKTIGDFTNPGFKI